MESDKQEKENQEHSAGDYLEPMITAWRTQIQEECSATINRLKERIFERIALTGSECPSGMAEK